MAEDRICVYTNKCKTKCDVGDGLELAKLHTSFGKFEVSKPVSLEAALAWFRPHVSAGLVKRLHHPGSAVYYFPTKVNYVLFIKLFIQGFDHCVLFVDCWHELRLDSAGLCLAEQNLRR
jgi:hypothetical protein